MRTALFAALGALTGCGEKTYDSHVCEGCGVVLEHDTGYYEDADGDGYQDYEDCDDEDAAVNPSADELCDGIDNNCDDNIDESGC